MSPRFLLISLMIALVFHLDGVSAQTADLILHNGRIVTVDKAFSIHEAIAVKDGRVLLTGGDAEVLKLANKNGTVIDLQGKTVLPGLMDSHTHPTGAAMFEFDHDIPTMESIADVLAYVKSRADVLDDGEWVFVSQVFITRLKERRYPTRAELDAVAPKNPVMFRTGPDGMLSSLALKLSGIDRDTRVTDGGTGFIEHDDAGEPTGILRSCTRLAKYQEPRGGKSAGDQDRYHRQRALFADYNAVGLTAIADRDADRSSVDLYAKLLERKELSVRIAVSRSLGSGGDVEAVKANVRKIAAEARAPKGSAGDDMLRIVGVKCYLDGGMLTGSAFMRKPWGVSKIYSITDPKYQGLRFIPQDKLVPIVREVIENGLQFTAHSVGDGAVHALIDAYEEVNKTLPVAKVRPCITHCNFMSAEAVERMATLGIVADIQPVWLYLDAATLHQQFGYDRLRYFQPLRSLFAAGVTVGGGSDHMQKIGSLRSVNPYNPWLGLWTTIARSPRSYDGRFHEEEALTRQQAVRFYTTNNARILFLDEVAGSLEKGKLADMIVIDRDVLTCKEEDIRDTQVLRTYLEGRLVYEKK